LFGDDSSYGRAIVGIDIDIDIGFVVVEYLKGVYGGRDCWLGFEDIGWG